MTPSDHKASRPSPLPQHVAVIMDGNGRWAAQRGLPRLAGHQAGVARVPSVVRCFAEEGIPYVTLYAFSTENWGRPVSEVQGLITLLAEAIEREASQLHRDGVRILHLGRLERLGRLGPGLAQGIRRVVEMTRNNTRLTLSVAFDYGGREEILEAVRRIVQDGRTPEEITEQVFARYLFSEGLPDPDLVVRTGGEMRLSNFLLWQGAYAEFYSTPVPWPEFGPEEVHKALQSYSLRRRRFGGLDSRD